MAAETDSRQATVETLNEAACPVIEAIDLVGTTWRLNVVHALAEGEQRFNDLKRATGARSKTLSDALEELVAADVVARRMEPASPVAVYYDLTPKGQALLDALSHLEEWAREWDEAPPTESSSRPGR